MQEEIKFAQQIKTLGLEEATIQKEIEAITKKFKCRRIKIIRNRRIK